MMPQKQKIISPLSLSNFNECDQKIFQQYLQNYCQMVQKKEKTNLQKQRKVNFFMEDQLENNQCQSNIFNNNLSYPSINLFEYKDIQSFTGVGSLKHIDLKQILSFQHLKQEDTGATCKIQHICKTGQDNAMIDQNKGEQAKLTSNLIKYQQPYFLGLSGRQARLKQIIFSADIIREELENTLRYFTKNISQ